MAEKRMFTKKITDADEFINLPSSTQALYLHLCMAADDDGFNNQIQMAMFKAHASIDDVKVLLTKRFILQFDNGVIVIKHWRMANALRKDRYTETAYKEELKKLRVKDNGAYTFIDGCQVVAERLPDGCQVVAADKNSIDKDNKNIITNILPPNDKTIFITIPLNDKTEYPVYDDDVKEYKSLYPAVDVEQQLRNMKGWCDANPSKRKTSKGIKRFITSWLCREQDRGGTKQESRRGFDANKGIMSSGYDFAALEAEVRNRGNNENI